MNNSAYFFDEHQKQSFQCEAVFALAKEEKVFFSIKNYPQEEFQCLIRKYSAQKISELKTQFDNMLSILDPNKAYNTFINILKTNFSNQKPVKTVKIKLNPWITNGIKKAIF